MDDCFVSVDIETSGPTPGRYGLLAVGACLVDDPDRGFYAELRPTGTETDASAVAVAGLSLERLAAEGELPEAAMLRFAAWVEDVVPGEARPVLVAFNAPFDWMFIADYLHRYVGRNPFGHSALDMKALWMGVAGRTWSETGFAQVAAYYGLDPVLSHHALEDARTQARLFRRILADLHGRRPQLSQNDKEAPE
jgi:DNA polymerase III epsilon subunit-like protein